MRKSSSTPMLLAVAGVAIGAMVLLNVVQYQNRPKTPQELAAEDEERMAKSGQPTPSPPPNRNDPAAKLVALGPDATIGPKDATKKLTLGYYWTPEVQGTPMRVYGPIEMIEKMGRSATGISIRVVNLDLPGAPKVPPGIAFNGKILAPLRPEGGFEPKMIQEVLPRIMQSQ